MQKHFDNGDTVQRLRLDVLDVIDGRSQRPLCNANDAVAHILGNETVEVPNNAHNGNVDVRKNVCWRSDDRERTHDQD